MQKENGYICIHIFDWDDLEDIIKLIKNPINIEENKYITKNNNKIIIDNSKIPMISLENYNLIKTIKPRSNWYNSKTKEHILDDNFDKELMIEHGFVEIYDCGQSVYVYKNIKGF